MQLTILFSILVVIPGVFTHSLENGDTDKSTPTFPVPKNFAIREIRWRLAANSADGMINADVEVSNHEYYDVRWSILEPGSSPDEYIQIPIAGSGPYQVYGQRYLAGGRAFIGGHLTIRLVPPVQHIQVMIEVASHHYGPVLTYKFTAAVSTGWYARTQVFRPETLEPVDFPHHSYNYGSEDQVKFDFTALGPTVSGVSAYRWTPSDDPNKIYGDVINAGDQPSAGVNIHATGVLADDGRTLTTVSLVVTMSPGSYEYRVELTADDVVLVYYLHVIPSGAESIYSGLHMALETCSGAPVTSSGPNDVTMELSSWNPDCVMCTAVGPNGVRLSLSRDGIPIGSGSSHVVFWYPFQQDMSVAYFIIYEHMYTYMYQMFSYAGEYTCTATSANGEEMSRDFSIEFN